MLTAISIFSGNDGVKPLRSVILTAINIFSGKDGLNL